MVADVNVPEAKRTAIEEGQPALVHVGVQPDHPLIGKVKSRGVMPVQQDWWGRGDVQRFQAVVEVPNPPAWLLPGLGCNAEITVKELADVIQVPIQAVFQRDDRQVCYVVDGTRIRCLPVRIGMDDDRMVEIKAGLEVGWKVMLAEPEDAMKIKVESPAFGPARPEPAGAELATVHPTTRPDPATQPEGAAGDPSGTPSEAEIAAIIARMRKAAPELAERLVKMSPDERLRTIVEIRKHLRGPDEHRVTPTTKPQGE
jgi:hypothetical protein